MPIYIYISILFERFTIITLYSFVIIRVRSLGYADLNHVEKLFPFVETLRILSSSGEAMID